MTIVLSEDLLLVWRVNSKRSVLNDFFKRDHNEGKYHGMSQLTCHLYVCLPSDRVGHFP